LIRHRAPGFPRRQRSSRCKKEAGASRLHWLTKEDNRTARLLYDKVAERSGFIQYRQML